MPRTVEGRRLLPRRRRQRRPCGPQPRHARCVPSSTPLAAPPCTTPSQKCTSRTRLRPRVAEREMVEGQRGGDTAKGFRTRAWAAEQILSAFLQQLGSTRGMRTHYSRPDRSNSHIQFHESSNVGGKTINPPWKPQQGQIKAPHFLAAPPKTRQL